MKFSDLQIERYARHILLPEIGGAGQTKIMDGRVLVIGAGFGLGLAEQYTGIVFGAEYQVASSVVLLLLVLMWRQIKLRQKREVVR